MLSKDETAQLLDDLCGRLGLSLPPEVRQSFFDAPPPDVDSFTAEVFAAEGLDTDTIERYHYRQVHAIVARAFALCRAQRAREDHA